jgi:hypothetical protein
MSEGVKRYILHAKYEPFPIDERLARSSPTQERLSEASGRLHQARDVNLLKGGLTPIRTRTRDTWSMGRNSLHHRR